MRYFNFFLIRIIERSEAFDDDGFKLDALDRVRLAVIRSLSSVSSGAYVKTGILPFASTVVVEPDSIDIDLRAGWDLLSSSVAR